MKITRIVAVVLAIVLTMGLCSAPAYAVSGSSLKAKDEKAEKQLVNYAEYWGWIAEVAVRSIRTERPMTP